MNLAQVARDYEKGLISKDEVFAIKAKDIFEVVNRNSRKCDEILCLQAKLASLDLERLKLQSKIFSLESELEMRPKKLQFVTYA